MLNRMTDADEGRRELEAEGRAYRARIRVASQAIVFGLAAIFAALAGLPTTTAADRAALLLTAGLVIVSGLGWFGLVPHGLFGAWRIFVAAAIAQGVLGVLITLTGTASSPYFAFFLLPPLVLIFSGDLRQVGLLATGAAIALIGIALAAAAPAGITVIRLSELAMFAAFGTIGARAFGNTRRTLATRAAVLASAYQAATNTVFKDPATGLPDRRYFDERISELIVAAKRRGLPFALVTFLVRPDPPQPGWDAQAIARPVAVSLRELLLPDEVLIRMDSDDFVVLLPEGDPARGYELAAAAAAAIGALGGIALSWTVVPVSLDASARGIRKRVAAALSASADRIDVADLADTAGGG